MQQGITVEASIIVLAKNEELYIEQTLKAIFRQKFNFEFEIIVIDSGSKDKTLEIIKKFPVSLIQIPPLEFGHGKTRNLGLNLSKGKYIVFLNADATPADSCWLNNLLRGFSSHKNVCGIYSKICPRENCNPLDARDILADDYLFDISNRVRFIDSAFAYKRLNVEKRRKFIAFHTISCAIDRNILSNNMFAEINFGEDLEWSKRMLEKGFKIIFANESKVIHSHDIHLSFCNTVKKYFDDAKLNQTLLRRWNLLNLSKLSVMYVFKYLKDAAYIMKEEKALFYKLSWIFYSPIIRLAEVFGILLGVLADMPKSLAKRLSLVEGKKAE